MNVWGAVMCVLVWKHTCTVRWMVWQTNPNAGKMKYTSEYFVIRSQVGFCLFDQIFSEYLENNGG